MGILPYASEDFVLWTADPEDFNTGWETSLNVYAQRQGNVVFLTGAFLYPGGDWYSDGGGVPLSVPSLFLPAPEAGEFGSAMMAVSYDAATSTSKIVTAFISQPDGDVTFQPLDLAPEGTTEGALILSGQYLLGPLFVEE